MENKRQWIISFKGNNFLGKNMNLTKNMNLKISSSEFPRWKLTLQILLEISSTLKTNCSLLKFKYWINIKQN